MADSSNHEALPWTKVHDRNNYGADIVLESAEARPWTSSKRSSRRSGSSDGYPWLKLVRGTMPRNARWLTSQPFPVKFMFAVLRGISQAFLLNNPVSGAIILLGAFLGDPYIASFGLVGVIVSTATACALLEEDANSIANGIFGYPGYLMGSGIALFHYPPEDSDSVYTMTLIIVVAMLSIGSVLMMLVSGRVIVATFGLAPLAIPFVLPLFVWILACTGMQFSYFPLNGSILAPTLESNPTMYPDIVTLSYSFSDVFDGVLHGISQIIFQESRMCAVLIVLGAYICSPIVSGMSVFGSLIAVLVAMALGIPSEAIRTGLWGFNASLSAICIGGMFFVLKAAKSGFGP